MGNEVNLKALDFDLDPNTFTIDAMKAGSTEYKLALYMKTWYESQIEEVESVVSLLESDINKQLNLNGVELNRRDSLLVVHGMKIATQLMEESFPIAFEANNSKSKS